MSFFDKFKRSKGPENSPMPHKVNSQLPGWFIIIVDQSESMSRAYSKGQDTTDYSRAQWAAKQINEFIAKICDQASVDGRVSRKAIITVIGYSSKIATDLSHESVRQLAHGWLPEYCEQQAGQEEDWIKPESEGLTFMSHPFRFVHGMIEHFFNNGPEAATNREKFEHSIPPLILHITDGRATELKDAGMQAELKASIDALRTMKGLPMPFAPLIFNFHISSDDAPECKYPTSSKELGKYEKLLFDLSSAVPLSWLQRIAAMDEEIPEGAVGLVVNGTAASLQQFLDLNSKWFK